MTAGYVQLRRGILTHLAQGRLTWSQCMGFILLVAAADHRSGLWHGSARNLAALAGAGDVSERQARRILDALEAKRYIRRFVSRGARGNYPILVSKYEITEGPKKGRRVSLADRSFWPQTAVDSKTCENEKQGGGEVEVEVGAR